MCGTEGKCRDFVMVLQLLDLTFHPDSDSKQLSMPSTELNLADYNLLMQFINNGTKLVVNMTSYGKLSTPLSGDYFHE